MINRTYSLHLSCCHASVLSHLSRPTLLIRKGFHQALGIGAIGTPATCGSWPPMLSSPLVRGLGSLRGSLLWKRPRRYPAGAQGPCPPVALELQPGTGRVTGMRRKVLNTAGHQTEGSAAVPCKSTCSQGARRAPRQRAVLLSQHPGRAGNSHSVAAEQGAGFVSRN